ncbi:recombination-associated protein RdgC [Marinobacter subterrani]|uniref:recombination-associated protein RdgC n=1 Tax=Marinobacter subterrani TaxID=1658765 RepID=UPI00235516F9|nr:recombination-associated protein RdgC [Marinobacter subterrani]
MSLKTLCAFRIAIDAIPSVSQINKAGREYESRECQFRETKAWGYKAFEKNRGTDEEFVQPLHNYRWLYLQIALWKRILPSAVVKQEANRKIRALEKERGEPLSKKEKREYQQEVHDQLLQKAFQKETVYQVIFDQETGQVWMDAPSESLQNDIIRLLRRSLNSLPVTPVFETGNLPSLFDAWVAGKLDLPKGISVGDKAKAIDPDDPQATVTLSHEDLHDPDIKNVLGSRMLKLLGLESEHLGCTLTDSGTLKSIVVSVDTEDGDADPNHMLTLWCMEMTRFIEQLSAAIGHSDEQPAFTVSIPETHSHEDKGLAPETGAEPSDE